MYANIRISSVYLYLLIVLNSGEKNDSTFVPTREWQVVKTGTSIPAGLHVRHNFQTGVTEAKLMDDDETKDANSSISSDNPLTKSLTLHPDQILLQPNGDESVRVRNNHIPQMITFPVDELKNHLKNIKQNNITRDFGAKHKRERTEKQNSSYTDLKKKFEAESHSVKITNDAELLKRYFQKFEMHKASITTDILTVAETKDVLDILSNIEYLIHQFENAHMFTDTNGMATVILPCINSTNNDIKTKALQLLGAAAQSNSKVQTKALESGFVQMILHILYTNRELKVKTKCLFALSALIRHFPLAQKTFIDHSGPEIFAKILADDRLEIQVRVLRLISDLAIEREDLKRIDEPEQRQKQMEDYSGTRFEDKLLTHCCQHLSKLLIARFMQVSSDQLNTENYAFLEAISESAVILYPMCKDKYQSDKDQLVIAINNILKMCVNLIITADADETDRLKDLQLVLEKLKTVINVPHDEL